MDVCWDKIVGRGKVSHRVGCLGDVNFTCSNFGM